MNILNWGNLSTSEQKKALTRPTAEQQDQLSDTVTEIINTVRMKGDLALYDYSKQFDRTALKALMINGEKIEQASQNINPESINAIQTAVNRIKNYHNCLMPIQQSVDTGDGLRCDRIPKPIQAVGLYVPGGTAPLVSTLMMLAIPAALANCPVKVLCTPPNQQGEVNPYLLYTAKLCGIETIFNVGGAQAIAAMAYGTESIPKVNKIFGPGNAWVTAAKQIVSRDPNGASIDMPAGPSEVMVIADDNADPDFIAADLLSQAEHGEDSQVMLITTSPDLAQFVLQAVQDQLQSLSRKAIATKSLAYSKIILVNSVTEAFSISNQYAPEHLILQLNDPRQYLNSVENAGAVFLGAMTPETLGDYITGSNHVLPTYGYAQTFSGLSVSDYMKSISVQESNQQGLNVLGRKAMLLAELEGLDAHKFAVEIRLKKMEALYG